MNDSLPFLTPAHISGGYSCPRRCPGGGGSGGGTCEPKFVGALQLKPMHGFSLNCQGMFNRR